MPTENAANQLNGFLLIDKPIGPTSHDVVATVRHIIRPYSKQSKVGHAGTLDPYASGLLILGIGTATKSLGRLLGLAKSYKATIRLGATTATDDAESIPVPTAGFEPPSQTAVMCALEKFIGTQMQTPPPFSAKKIHGVASYVHARQGKPVALAPVMISIPKLELIAFSGVEVKISLTCSSGTYVRALGRDLGAALGTGAYLTELRRTAIGPFLVDDALSLAALTEQSINNHLIAIEEVLTELPTMAST